MPSFEYTLSGHIDAQLPVQKFQSITSSTGATGGTLFGSSELVLQPVTVAAQPSAALAFKKLLRSIDISSRSINDAS